MYYIPKNYKNHGDVVYKLHNGVAYTLPNMRAVEYACQCCHINNINVIDDIRSSLLDNILDFVRSSEKICCPIVRYAYPNQSIIVTIIHKGDVYTIELGDIISIYNHVYNITNNNANRVSVSNAPILLLHIEYAAYNNQIIDFLNELSICQ